MITAIEAREMVEKIRAEAGDDERAHVDEDELRTRVLDAIASGAPNAVELANIALAAADIKFCRWCA